MRPDREQPPAEEATNAELDAWISDARRAWRPAPPDPDRFAEGLVRRRRRRRAVDAASGVIVALLVGAVALWWPRPAPVDDATRVAVANEPTAADRQDPPDERELDRSVRPLRTLEPWTAAAIGRTELPGAGGVEVIYGDVSRSSRLAQARPPRPGGPPRPVEVLLERGDEFGLSGASIERMVAIAEAARDGRAPLLRRVEDERARLEDLLLEAAPDPDDVRSAVEALGAAETALRAYDVDVMLQMRATLTDEELEAFREMFPMPGHGRPPHPPR